MTRLARSIEPYGSQPKPAFNPAPNARVNSVVVQNDGKILFAGGFTGVGQTFTLRRIARSNADGSLDTAFAPVVSVNPGEGVFGLAVQADGKILLAGDFTSVGGAPRNGIARLNPDGSLDTSFNPNANFVSYSVAVQADGKILIGGRFTTVGGTTRNRLARLNADGSLDTGFDPPTVSRQADGTQPAVVTLAVQADGKILLGGYFTSVGGTTRNCIARLNADGSLDTGFNPDATSSSIVYTLAVQADGKIMVGGTFTSLGGTTRNRIALLNADGSLDSGFNPNASGPVLAVAIQDDGQVLIGGEFSGIAGSSGTFAKFLVRLANAAATQTLAATGATRVEWLRGGSAPEVSPATFELTTDGGTTWSALGNGTRISGGWELTGLTLPASGSLRARGRTTGGQYNGSSGLVEQVQAFTSPPVITSPTTASGTYGLSSFSYTITATNSPASYGATGLPTGLSVNTSNGQITGTPTDTSGSPYSVTISATNGGGTGSATLVFTINKAALTISGVTASHKTYDATTTATLNTGSTTLNGAVGGDSLTLNTGSATGAFADNTVGTGKTVSTSSFSVTGTNASHYTLTQPSTTANITAKALAVSGLSASNKVYDATTGATLTGTAALLAGVNAGGGSAGDGKPYNGDDVSLGGTASGAFAGKDVASGVGVSVTGLTLSGAQASNYAVTQPTGLTANITSKTLTVGGVTAGDKVYDATTSATLSGTAALLSAEAPGAGTTSDGKPYTGDTLSLSGTASGAFADKNVGAGKSVTVSGLTLGGGQAGNYLLGALAVTANITTKTLTVSGLSASNKTYDATTSASLTADKRGPADKRGHV